MTLADLKGHLIARQANLAAELRQKRQTVVLIEADLLRARREADTLSGALQATEQVLGDVETGQVRSLPTGRETVSGAGLPIP
ncbi:MAG: hypothetical protein HZC55_21125 [Verrucomicrobia bacterium]|nr:hypothetical protein [Verrucomicrobiota bacterium]